ncbi:MAG: hypothetical protein ACI4NE_04920 [Succinivibrio sp.]
MKLTVLSSLFFAIFVTGCTLEDENAEKIVDKQLLASVSNNKEQQELLSKISICVEGDLSQLDDVVKTYTSSLSIKDVNYKEAFPDLEIKQDGSYLYQTESLTREYEKCLLNAKDDEHAKYTAFIIVKAHSCGRISRYFYTNGDLKNGSYWAQRAVNLVGKSSGYYILGKLFTENERTMESGIALLLESAKLGNQNAANYISDSVTVDSVFDIIRFEKNIKNN